MAIALRPSSSEGGECTLAERAVSDQPLAATQIVPLTAARTVRAPLQALEVIRAWDEQSPVLLLQETNWFRQEETIQALEGFKEDVFLSWGSYPLQEIRALLNFPGYYLTEAQDTCRKSGHSNFPGRALIRCLQKPTPGNQPCSCWQSSQYWSFTRRFLTAW